MDYPTPPGRDSPPVPRHSRDDQDNAALQAANHPSDRSPRALPWAEEWPALGPTNFPPQVSRTSGPRDGAAEPLPRLGSDRRAGYNTASMSDPTSSGITTPLGFRAAGGTCGLKASGKPDLMLLVAEVDCTAAGVFTTNRMKSAPVLVDQRHLAHSRGKARAIVCNSGNANASTGAAGVRDAWTMCKQVADAVGCRPEEVLVSSTGIIGRPLPMAKIALGIGDLAGRLDRGDAVDAAAAGAIMTTDLVPKSAYQQVKLGGKTVRLAGIAKGSGMIAPNMATLLAFVTTDAAINAAHLRKALQEAARGSFNRISVDQHTSPSDTLLILASGLARNTPIRTSGKDYARFRDALLALCKDLAYQVVKDGEGATRVYRVTVVNAASTREADAVGKAIVDSPLVKCAVHGGDPNWGRITTAAGYAGQSIDPERMSLYIGPKRKVCVFRKGQPTQAGQSPTPQLAQLMTEKEVQFTIDLGMGTAGAEWLGCDLSREYVRINADYTT
ncbi:MAG: bifunctional glutamate N-acetyltransferase/amino-acid acetyltransferase ArgJ [Phycisphaeraceae bacterium]